MSTFIDDLYELEWDDLGDEHGIRYSSTAAREDFPKIERAGALLIHRDSQGKWCMGGIHFDTEEVRKLRAKTNDTFPRGPLWQVESWEPLTISPSVLCSCGDHGFIREGKWVRA